MYLSLPICLLLYFILHGIKARNYLLLVMSLLFYAWGEPKWIILMIVTTLIDYGAGLLVDQYRGQKLAKWALAGSVVITLSFLAVFKYLGFFNQNLNQIFGAELPTQIFNLPIGISFYTFQAITYVVDVYRGKAQVQRSYANLLLYVALFPQLIAGPIVRYTDIAAQLENREMTLPGFSKVITRFVTGLGKKVLLANIAGQVATSLIGGDLSKASVLGAWLGIFAYTFQIYFDFSGYSDMAIGLGHMFGFTYVENFNYPYISKSITEFWRRWHISLSTFFRDYVYIPLGGNREGTLKTYRNLMIVFFLTGLWHGASWNFVIWGLFHGTFLVLERIFPIEKILHFRLLKSIYTLLVVIVAWVFFRAENLTAALDYLKRMFVPYKTDVHSAYLSNEFMMVAALGLVSCGFLTLIFDKLPVKTEYKFGFLRLVNPAWCAVIAYFSVLLLASNTYNPFIYFRF